MNATIRIIRERMKTSKLLTPCVMIFALFIVGEIILRGFSSVANISNVMTYACLIATVTLSQMFVMVVDADGIDLSVGAVMSMSALMVAKLCDNDISRLPFSLLVVVLLGALVGFLNFCGIYLLKAPPMIMTMIMGTVVNGFNYFYTKGIVSGDIPEILLSMGKQIAGPLKTIFFAVLILFFLVYLLQRKRTIGKLVYLIGSNANAAVLCGAKAKMVCAYSFMMSSVLAVFGGVVLLGMSGAAVLKMGEDFVMMSVAAAVIGGIKAGEGKIFGCYLGAVIIQLTSSLLIAANLPDSIRIFLQGIVLLAILSTFASKPRLQQ